MTSYFAHDFNKTTSKLIFISKDYSINYYLNRQLDTRFYPCFLSNEHMQRQNLFLYVKIKISQKLANTKTIICLLNGRGTCFSSRP